MMLKKFLLAFTLILPLLTIAQNQYELKFIVKGLPDSLMYLGSYYGDKMKLEDTATYNTSNGEIVFSGKENLPPGVYFLVNSEKKRLFEFVLDKDCFFTYETDTSDYVKNSIITNSPDNQTFLEYQIKTSELYKQMSDLQNLLKNTNDEEEKKRIRKEISDINKRNIAYKKSFLKENPDHLLSLILKTIAEPEIPDSLKGQDQESRQKAYQHYKNHYWDDVDLSDKRLLRTPVFHNKFENYFEKIIPKHPDSIITEIDQLLSATKDNKKLYKYLLFELTAKYEQSKVMGYDEIFVHLVDFYFTDTTYSWISMSIQQNMIERVEKIKPLLIGKKAPNLILADTMDGFKALYDIKNEYTIVIFWTTSCSECKNEIKILKDFYQDKAYDFEIFAVNTDTSFSKWKKYVVKNELPWINVNGTRSITNDYHILYDVFKTPTVYLLDKNFRIIAKHLSAEQTGAFLERERKKKTMKD